MLQDDRSDHQLTNLFKLMLKTRSSSAEETFKARHAQDNRITSSSRKFSKAYEHKNSENQSQRSSHKIRNRLKKKKS
jgi:hypothetical protein